MNYVNEIAAFFLKHFSDIGILDPADYTLIAEWEKRMIPIDIVLNSIDAASLKENSEIKSIRSCEEMVIRNFREWLRTRTVESEFENNI